MFDQLDLGELTAMLGRASAVAARIVPVVVFTPAFGGQLVPAQQRFALAILLAGVFWPGADAVDAAARLRGGLVPFIAAELLIGSVLAMLVLFCFEIAATCGALIEFHRGAAMAALLDPGSQQQQPPLALFYRYLTIVAFFATGAHRVLIDALAASYANLPLSASLPVGCVDGRFLSLAIHSAGALVEQALRLATPVIAFAFLLDVALGLVNRTTGKLDAYQIGLIVKPWLCLMVALITLCATVSGALDAVLAQIEFLAPMLAELRNG